jgi:uncharacterized hydrophobic protein (TIGR00271 family)
MEQRENKKDPLNLNEDEQFERVKLTALQSIKKFFLELVDIQSNTDRDSTVEAVKQDISFKGHNSWILIFSIFVASIGLNISSTAVVIGAMLISPLMGPIVGLGLSVAINDVETLRRSITNLLVMIGLSVFTAYLYFELSPLTKETPELLARTYPTILDVLIAIFGGLALIVAKTKKGTIASVIFGVAIATALMPPLCTVGYGLAVGNISYAGGALYLFSINAVFIALTTYITAKILRFPLVRYANSKKRKRIAQFATLIAILVIIPSVILFLNLLEQQLFDNRASNFVDNTINYDGAEVVKYTKNHDTKDIDVYLIGQVVPQNQIVKWQEELKQNEKLKEANLRIYQGADQSVAIAEKLTNEVKSGILEDLYVKNEQMIRDKNERIEFLEDEIAKLKVKEVQFEKLSEEAKIIYKNLNSFSFSNRITTNFDKTDTLSVFYVSWSEDTRRKQREEDMANIAEWLKFQLNLDTLRVIEFK